MFPSSLDAELVVVRFVVCKFLTRLALLRCLCVPPRYCVARLEFSVNAKGTKEMKLGYRSNSVVVLIPLLASHLLW